RPGQGRGPPACHSEVTGGVAQPPAGCLDHAEGRTSHRPARVRGTAFGDRGSFVQSATIRPNGELRERPGTEYRRGTPPTSFTTADTRPARTPGRRLFLTPKRRLA